MRYLLIAILSWGLGAGAVHAQERLELSHFTPKEYSGVNLPFSFSVRAGSLLFISGMLGNKSGAPTLVEGGIEAETQQAMNNLKAILAENGLSMDRVVRCSIFLADLSEFSAMNSIYLSYFHQPLPARTAVGVFGLALGARVEIECIAAF